MGDGERQHFGVSLVRIITPNGDWERSLRVSVVTRWKSGVIALEHGRRVARDPEGDGNGLRRGTPVVCYVELEGIRDGLRVGELRRPLHV